MKKFHKDDQRGFTLAELLIVVAIIAVLAAISIPIFSTQLERSREATDLANARSAYAEVVSDYLGDGKAHEISFEVVQTEEGWDYVDGVIGTEMTGKTENSNGSMAADTSIGGGSYTIGDVASTTANNTITIAIDNTGKITITPAA